MTGSNILARLQQHVRQRGRLWLFMDYDGTLVPIAPTPDQARPDPRLLALLASLAQVPAFRTAIVSGRSLASLQSLLPIPGLILAGVYGLEVQMAGRAIVRGQVRQEVRPAVAYVKARWAELVAGRDGFLIEDKDRAVALHARWAAAGEADQVLKKAYAAAEPFLSGDGLRLLGGHRFLELAPQAANKGRAVEWLLEQVAFLGALPVYFGDDDKDEEAFEVIHGLGGYPIGVGSRFPLPGAAERLPGPDSVRGWLNALCEEWRRSPPIPGEEG